MPDADKDDQIDLRAAGEVRRWTETLGVDEDQLRTAIEHAGPSVEAVRKYLGSHS